jgi:hypothetical protein
MMFQSARTSSVRMFRGAYKPFLFLIAGAIGGSVPIAFAVLAWLATPAVATPIFGDATITYSEKASSGPTAGAPSFAPGPTKELESAGSNHPTFTTTILPVQSASTVGPTGLFNPAPALSKTAPPPAVFDSASTSLTAFNSGLSPAFVVRANPLFAIASDSAGYAALDWTANLGVRNDLGFAVVGQVTTSLNFIFEIPHSLGGYAATSLYVTVTDGVNDFPIMPIVLATDGLGLLPDVASGDFSSLTFIGYDSGRDMDRYRAKGKSQSGPVTLLNGDQWEIHGTFSCVVDPGAACLNQGGELISSQVPEPGSLWLMLSGLLATALLSRRRITEIRTAREAC